MKVIVTGAAGYLGCMVVAGLLRRDHNVLAVDDLSVGTTAGIAPFLGLGERYVFHRIDVGSEAFLSSLVTDFTRSSATIVHLAGTRLAECEQEGKAAAAHANNVVLPHVVAKASCGHFIFASSASVYGQCEWATEETNPEPIGGYATSKVLAEATLADRHRVTVLRLGTLVGASPVQRYDTFANMIASRIDVDGSVSLWRGDAYRPWLHIQDAVDAIVRCVEVGPVAERTFNIVGSNLTKTAITDMARAFGRVMVTEIVEADDDKRDYQVSNSLARTSKLKIRNSRPIVYGIGDVHLICKSLGRTRVAV